MKEKDFFEKQEEIHEGATLFDYEEVYANKKRTLFNYDKDTKQQKEDYNLFNYQNYNSNKKSNTKNNDDRQM